MTHPNELTLVEIPLVKYLTETLGYIYIHPDQHADLREGPAQALFKPILIEQLCALNSIDVAEATSVFNALANLTDNAAWLKRLRNKTSRRFRGESTSSPVVLVDYDNPQNNHFAVTQQLSLKGNPNIRPDLVVYLNGIPVVVIEVKSPLNPKHDTFDAIVQIRGYEKAAPRLFAPNLFNIATNKTSFRYGATGAPRQFWSDWRDPWPRAADEFADPVERGAWALLDKARLLDILAHFIVFETDPETKTTVKKMCRYQQFRAVNKMVARVREAQHRVGLIWHTQGSGKSLTMVFAALKLKFHRGIKDPALTNPNLLVLTDRIALHEQITRTFRAVGIQNVIAIDGIQRPTDADGNPIPDGKGKTRHYLQDEVVATATGKIMLSTIFKFHWNNPALFSKNKHEARTALEALAVPNSDRWILMIDECHRTQEKDLGAYLRAILPEARRFGFTGTPVKSNDLNTFQTFSVGDEGYLDKYGIDDAIADGATVPVKFQSRRTLWTLDAPKLDIAFDQTFAHIPEATAEELKKRGLTKSDLARLRTRIDLIAYDIWTHFKTHVMAKGYKAQVVAIDRASCVAYKEALDREIASDLQSEGMPADEAKETAKAMSACVYSAAQLDKEKFPKIHEHQLDDTEVKAAIKAFKDPEAPLQLVIVCSKLLTGFDAPIEQAMYLDNPLRDHNLLQAIARTNRRYGPKEYGLIVDYIGVFKNLKETLSAYRADDVQSAATDYDGLADDLTAAHRAVMDMIRQVKRTDDPDADAKAVRDHIATEDRWLIFKGKAAAFVKAYGALMPDPRALQYRADLKFIGACLVYCRQLFDAAEDFDWKQYGKQLRALLDKHLTVTGLKTALKLRKLSDPLFWAEYEKVKEGEADAKTAAIHKLAELQKITSEAAAKNAAQFGSFSERVKAVMKAFQAGMDAMEALAQSKQIADDLKSEQSKHESTGLSKRAYGVAAVLEQFKAKAEPEEEGEETSPEGSKGGEAGGQGGRSGLTAVQEAAKQIDAIYAAAPKGWQGMAQRKKKLRLEVALVVKALGMDGWMDTVPKAVEAYALGHYSGE